MDRIAALRKDYTQAELSEGDLTPNPFAQFSHWFEQALRAELPEPNAMTLATVSADGRPAARIVLIKGFDERGFCFYTNYDSRKGHELSAKPLAALLFHWMPLERQVRIRGHVTPVSDAEADAYFATREHGKQIGAWASHQSEPLSSHAALIARAAELELKYALSPVPRPPHWSGYRVSPQEIEFWSQGTFRLHDRMLFTRKGEGWETVRLNP